MKVGAFCFLATMDLQTYSLCDVRLVCETESTGVRMSVIICWTWSSFLCVGDRIDEFIKGVSGENALKAMQRIISVTVQ